MERVKPFCGHIRHKERRGLFNGRAVGTRAHHFQSQRARFAVGAQPFVRRAADRRNLIGMPSSRRLCRRHGKWCGHRQGEAKRSSPPAGLTARAVPRGILHLISRSFAVSTTASSSAPFALPHRLLYIRRIVDREVEDRSRCTLLPILRQVQKRYDRIL